MTEENGGGSERIGAFFPKISTTAVTRMPRNLLVNGVCGVLLLSGCATSQEVLDQSASQRLSGANVPKLSQSEMYLLYGQLQACWAPPIGVAEAKEPVVVIRFALNRDGTLSGEPSVVNKGSTPLFQAAAESAMQAVRRCQPFRLPTSKYEAWREVEVNFDARPGLGSSSPVTAR